ncbi:hypothetical protein PO909_015733 [Leuciscus waleckii]
MRTLNNLSDLKESKFGRPPPRHGLILLWWFANECVQIDFNSRMVALCNPKNGAFGFHRFYNRENLLPNTNLPYYEVGNLHITDSLPEYVTVNYKGYSDNSNKDRIIVLFNLRWNRFESIYVTQHSDMVNFDQNHTYCISIELMKIIQDLSCEEFLRGPIHKNPPNPPQDIRTKLPSLDLLQEQITEEVKRHHQMYKEKMKDYADKTNRAKDQGDVVYGANMEQGKLDSKFKSASRLLLCFCELAAVGVECGLQKSRIVRNTMRTLNNLSDLRESRFGQPSPRHGLKLLWWFAYECVHIDSNGRMVALYNPKYGAFGFHRFYNADKLLPYSNIPFYEVGNLHITDSLPEYVTEDDTGFLDDDSNTDRIIVLFKWFTRRFDNIYVTKHSDQTNFDRNQTYCISSDLMKEIKELSREEFLKKTLNESYQIHYQMQCSQFPSAAHRIVRNTMRTLNNLSDLKKSKFGRPPPRHGLILLWWFAHECVQIDFNSRMVALCNPKNGAFGFHRFYNRENLLPYSDRLYYEVGNLNITDSLPEYVTVYYTGRSDDDSNTDRIIVLFNSRRKIFESIYVTRHSDLVNFDQNHTYCISIELMKIIQDLSCEEFLRGPIRKNPPNPPQYVSIDIPWPYHPHVPARLPHTPQPHTPQPHTPPPVQTETCRSLSVNNSPYP